MGFIYVYANLYFNEKNIRKIGSTLNPFIRLNTYTTYYQDKGTFEYLFSITEDRLFEIETALKNKYLYNYNTKNNGSTGGTEIYQNINIKETIVKCFNDMELIWTELDPSFPPITKKYINVVEREALKDHRENYKILNKKIEYNKIVTKKLSKQEIIKIIKIDNGDKNKDEITFCNGIEDRIKTNSLGFETGVKNLGIYIIYRYSNNSDFIEFNSIINKKHFKKLNDKTDLWLTLITKDFKEISMNNEWVSVGAPISVFPVSHFKQTLYNGLIINDSIAVFNLPVDTYLCSLNTTPPKKYGQILDLNIDKITEVGTQYGYYNLPEIRKSKYTYSQFNFNGENLKDIVMENLKGIVPNNKHEEIHWNTTLKYKVLEYNKGDFFAEHSDHKINKRHYATMLIFPPSEGDLSHDGGNLVIKTGTFETVIPTSLNKNWKCVAFLTELKHQCYEIISGKRIVLKVELVYKKNYFSDLNSHGCVD